MRICVTKLPVIINIPPKISVKTKVPDLKHKTVWYRRPKTLGKEAFKFRETLTNCSFWSQNALRIMCHCKWCRTLGKLYCGMTACRRMLQTQLNLSFRIPCFRVAATNLARSWSRDMLLQHWTLKQELTERRKSRTEIKQADCLLTDYDCLITIAQKIETDTLTFWDTTDVVGDMVIFTCLLLYLFSCI